MCEGAASLADDRFLISLHTCFGISPLSSSSHLQFVLQLLVLLGLGESLLLHVVVAEVLRLQLSAVGAVLFAVLVVALAVGGGGRGGGGNGISSPDVLQLLLRPHQILLHFCNLA